MNFFFFFLISGQNLDEGPEGENTDVSILGTGNRPKLYGGTETPSLPMTFSAVILVLFRLLSVGNLS